MRVVLDTNVLVSATFSDQGNPAEILRLWEQGAIAVVKSEAALGELRRVLTYPKVAQFCRYTPTELEIYLSLLRTESILVTPEEEIDVITADPTDNLFLATAVAGQAEFLITGDNHLLAIGRFRGIEIVSPVVFLAGYGGEL